MICDGGPPPPQSRQEVGGFGSCEFRAPSLDRISGTPVTMLFCCTSDTYLGSPEWRWICPARIRSNRHVIPSMTLPGGQNFEFEIPRCEGKEELPPDPGRGWLPLRHTGSLGTSRMQQLCRPFRDVCLGSLLQWPPMRRHMLGSADVSMAMRSQDSAVNDDASIRMAAIIAHSA